AASAEQVEDLVDIAVSECERFYPAFQLVIWGGKSPDDAMTAAIIEPIGEACPREADGRGGFRPRRHLTAGRLRPDGLGDAARLARTRRRRALHRHTAGPCSQLLWRTIGALA